MKISFGSKIIEGPYGGGNNFLKNLKQFFEQNGHRVVTDLKDNDIDMMNMLRDFGKHFQIILTKVDKEKVNEAYIADIKSYLAALGHPDCNILPTSSKSGAGMKELQYSMLQLYF